MIRHLPAALAAIAAVTFTVAFAARLASPTREEQPRAPVLQAVGGRSSPVVPDPARLRSAAALPVLQVPRATPTPAPMRVIAPEPPHAEPSGDEPAGLSVAPAPVAPAPTPSAPAPPAPQQSPEPSQHGPTFDSSG